MRLKNNSVAKVNVHLDAEHVSDLGEASLNMHHLVLFLASNICWVTHPLIYIFSSQSIWPSVLKLKPLWSEIAWGFETRNVFTNAEWVCPKSQNINRSWTCVYSTSCRSLSYLFWNAVEVLQAELSPAAKCIAKKAQMSGAHNQVKMWSWELAWWLGICSLISPSCLQTSVRFWHASRSE